VWRPRLRGEERTDRAHGVCGWCRTRLTSTTNTEQPTMTKAEMIQRIAQELGCTTAQAAGAVEAILTTIKASLQ
jgi:hypothetical protein